MFSIYTTYLFTETKMYSTLKTISYLPFRCHFTTLPRWNWNIEFNQKYSYILFFCLFMIWKVGKNNLKYNIFLSSCHCVWSRIPSISQERRIFTLVEKSILYFQHANSRISCWKMVERFRKSQILKSLYE